MITSRRENINNYMTGHHRMLSTMFQDWKRPRNQNGKKSFRILCKFAGHPLIHIWIEERVIFPIYETKFPGSADATPILKQQHTRIKAHLNATRKRFTNDPGKACGPDAEFERLLDVHNATEEYTICPWSDALASFEVNEMVSSILNSLCRDQLDGNKESL